MTALSACHRARAAWEAAGRPGPSGPQLVLVPFALDEGEEPVAECPPGVRADHGVGCGLSLVERVAGTADGVPHPPRGTNSPGALTIGTEEGGAPTPPMTEAALPAIRESSAFVPSENTTRGGALRCQVVCAAPLKGV